MSEVLCERPWLATWIPNVLSLSQSTTHYSDIPPHHTLSFSTILFFLVSASLVWNVPHGLLCLNTCSPAYGTVLGGAEPLKWEVWLVKMSHWEWAFDRHRLAGALLTSWFIKMNKSYHGQTASHHDLCHHQAVSNSDEKVTNRPSVHTSTTTNKTKIQSPSVPILLRKHQTHRKLGKTHTGIWQSGSS